MCADVGYGDGTIVSLKSLLLCLSLYRVIIKCRAFENGTRCGLLKVRAEGARLDNRPGVRHVTAISVC